MSKSSQYNRIIENFRKKPSEELTEIIEARDLDEWAEEAFAAAEVVLSERRDGVSSYSPTPTKRESPPIPAQQIPSPNVEDNLHQESDRAPEVVQQESPVDGQPLSYDEFFSEGVNSITDLPPDSSAPVTEEQQTGTPSIVTKTMEIFIAKREQRTGPFTVQQIETMISSQMVDISDMAWHSELTDWLPLYQVLGICPPLPRTTSPPIPLDAPQEKQFQKKRKRDTTKTPKAKGIADLLAYALLGFLMFLLVLFGVSGIALAVRSTGDVMGPGIKIILGPLIGVIFLSLGYAVLIPYRHYNRRYYGRSLQDYKGGFGTKMKPSEAVSGWLMGGAILVALASGLPIFFVDFALMILASILFVFSFDRTQQHKHLKRLRREELT